MKETHTIEIPSMNEVSFEIIVSAEDAPIKGNALASGDDKQDRKAEQYIQRSLDAGNIWAWASVEVKATWHGLEHSDYRGCCSYKNEKQFRNDGYYADMCNEAYTGLIKQIKAL